MAADTVRLLPNRWQCYVGILTESTVVRNQRKFHVFVPEFLPTKSGNVDSNDLEMSVSLWNEFNKAQEEANVRITSTIVADYFGLTSGFDVPTMYRGMQVLVINYGNTDRWYWLPLERDDNLKTFAQQRFSCPDIAQTNKSDAIKSDIEGRTEGLTDDNTYFLEIDTKYHKHIKISTAASDGEKFRYFFKIDADEHSVELWDNCVDGSQPNNTFKIESRPDSSTLGRITMQNASGNSYIMDGMDTKIFIPRNLSINVGGDTVISCIGNVTKSITGVATTTIHGNEFREITGSAQHIYMDSFTEGVYKNKMVSVIYNYTEEYMNKTSIGAATSISSTTYNLTAGTGNFAINAFTGVYQTVNQQVANVWSLICENWQETARRIAGTVVNLIRGGHH